MILIKTIVNLSLFKFYNINFQAFTIIFPNWFFIYFD